MSTVPRPVAVGSINTRLAVGAIAQLAARLVHLAVNITTSLVLIRYFTPGRYGDYVFVVSVCGFLLLLSEFGMRNHAVRELSRDAANVGEIVGTATAARMITAITATVVGQLACIAFGVNRTTQLAVAVSSLIYFTEAILTVTVIFQVRLRQEVEALVRTSIELVELILVITAVRLGFGLVAVATAPIIGAVFGIAIASAVASNRFGLRPSVAWSALPGLFRRAAPLALIGVAGAAYLKLDAFAVAVFRPRSDVGLYGAAFQPIEHTLITTIVVVNVLFPVLARSYGKEPERFANVYQGGMEVLLALVLPIPVLLSVVGRAAVTSVYGPSYASAFRPMMALAIALVMIVANVWQGFALVAAGNQRATLFAVGPAIAINIAIDVPLVIRYGPLGAALGTLATAAFLVTCSSRAVTRITGCRLDQARLLRLSGCAVALWVVGAGFQAATQSHWWITSVVVGSAWVLLLWLTGSVRMPLQGDGVGQSVRYDVGSGVS